MDTQHSIRSEIFEAIKREENGLSLTSEERAALCEKLRVSERLNSADDEELYGLYVLDAAKHRKHPR